MNYTIEITRNNVTPAKFFAEIRFACKKKGIDFDLELDQFAEPIQKNNCWYHIIGGKKIYYSGNYRYEEPADNAPCKAETCKNLPYDYQAYILNWDSSMYNEICEFTFDDETHGHGYYFQANRDAMSEELS